MRKRLERHASRDALRRLTGSPRIDTPRKLRREIRRYDKLIAAYMAELDAAIAREEGQVSAHPTRSRHRLGLLYGVRAKLLARRLDEITQEEMDLEL